MLVAGAVKADASLSPLLQVAKGAPILVAAGVKSYPGSSTIPLTMRQHVKKKGEHIRHMHVPERCSDWPIPGGSIEDVPVIIICGAKPHLLASVYLTCHRLFG